MLTTFLLQNTFMIILFLGMMLLIATDNYLPKKVRYKGFLILFILFTLILQNHLEAHIVIPKYQLFHLTFINTYELSIRPIIILMFLGMMTKTRYNIALWAIAAANCVLELISLVPGLHLTFWYENNQILYGPLIYVPYLVSLLFTLFLFIEGLHRYSQERWRGEFILLYISVIIFFCVVMDMLNISNSSANRTHWAMSAGCLFYFLYQHMQSMKNHQAEQLSKYQNQLMISQIQPHFIFNTMTTIQALCRINPELASQTISKFSQYLRNNLDNINQDLPVLLYKELDHTQTYVDIEKIRFPYINVSFDIQDDAFSLPALTIQPMVENAIRHGIRGTENGHIEIKTYHTDKNHIVEIRDNGKGFDTAAYSTIEKSNNPCGISNSHDSNSQSSHNSNSQSFHDINHNTHIGISNVRERIEKMMGGTLTVESQPGVGTNIIISIPL